MKLWSLGRKLWFTQRFDEITACNRIRVYENITVSHDLVWKKGVLVNWHCCLLFTPTWRCWVMSSNVCFTSTVKRLDIKLGKYFTYGIFSSVTLKKYIIVICVPIYLYTNKVNKLTWFSCLLNTPDMKNTLDNLI